MSARQRLVLVFVGDGDQVLLVQRPVRAASYGGRWTTVSGIIGSGESAPEAARQALEAELPGTPVRLERAGLHVDFSDTWKKRSLSFRVYPFLARLEAARPEPPSARWVSVLEVIHACALGETVPELDEALARVWDPPGALPPQFRAEARALSASGDLSRDLARRAAALVAAGAPPERVAALRPARARVVLAARAAARNATARDVPGELMRAEAGMRRFAESEARRAGGDAPHVAFAETILPTGDAVLRAAPPPGRLWIAADPWTEWDDDVPPPLEPGMVLVRRAAYDRLLTLPS